MTPHATEHGGELTRAARGSLVTLIGTAGSAVLGFAFNIVLARTLGAAGAGVVLQAVAVFTIILGVARLGLDTTSVWLLPQLRSTEPAKTRQATVALLVPAFVAPLAVSAAWYAVHFLFGWQLGLDAETVKSLNVAMAFLPAASVMMVALGGTRAFGGVLPYNAIGNVAVPGLRPGLVWMASALGGGTAAATLGWSAPWFVGAVLATVVLLRQVLKASARDPGSWRPEREIRERIRRFALPRVVASGLDQGIIWLDVVLVGILVGSASAGVYGTVSRFVSAGALVATALRIVVAPRFSALLSEGKVAEVEKLYTATARWILLLGSPAYVVLAVFAPTVLRWLGPGFAHGQASMVVLCLGSIVVLAAGNVQSLLLMSGRSAASAVNKAIVLAFNVGANLVLVPRFGIIGAASAWAASMALDTTLAAWQVRRRVGVSVAVGSISYAAGIVLVTVGLPAVAIARLLGQGNAQLVLAILVGGVALLGYAYLDRQRLDLTQFKLRVRQDR